tara:strand:+ start:587 stop:697 length:111 start_codon:yes stop_codon:yes gene_type:complete
MNRNMEREKKGYCIRCFSCVRPCGKEKDADKTKEFK